MPGCGKTTIIKKIIEDLRKKEITKVKGFYTTECRDNNGERSGFDIFTLDGLTSALARINSSTNKTSVYKVGKYNVYIDEFEKMCMKYVESNDGSLLIIDEIGKMELLSKRFEGAIKNILKIDENLKVLATVPFKSTSSLIDQLKNRKENVKIFHITKSNRDNIYSEIYEALQDMIK